MADKAAERTQRYLGRLEHVLVEGRNPKDASQVMGRTRGNRLAFSAGMWNPCAGASSPFALPRRAPLASARLLPFYRFSLFSAVALMFAQLYRKHPTPARAVPGYAKPEPTFVDALAAVRRKLWSGFLKPPAIPRPWQNPLPPIIDTLLDCLCYAA